MEFRTDHVVFPAFEDVLDIRSGKVALLFQHAHYFRAVLPGGEQFLAFFQVLQFDPDIFQVRFHFARHIQRFLQLLFQAGDLSACLLYPLGAGQRALFIGFPGRHRPSRPEFCLFLAGVEFLLQFLLQILQGAQVDAGLGADRLQVPDGSAGQRFVIFQMIRGGIDLAFYADEQSFQCLHGLAPVVCEYEREWSKDRANKSDTGKSRGYVVLPFRANQTIFILCRHDQHEMYIPQ